jgi:hypothetical protein
MIGLQRLEVVVVAIDPDVHTVVQERNELLDQAGVVAARRRVDLVVSVGDLPLRRARANGLIEAAS